MDRICYGNDSKCDIGLHAIGEKISPVACIVAVLPAVNILVPNESVCVTLEVFRLVIVDELQATTRSRYVD